MIACEALLSFFKSTAPDSDKENHSNDTSISSNTAVKVRDIGLNASKKRKLSVTKLSPSNHSLFAKKNKFLKIQEIKHNEVSQNELEEVKMKLVFLVN